MPTVRWHRANEEDEPAFGTQGDFLQDVLNGPTLTKTRSGLHPCTLDLLHLLLTQAQPMTHLRTSHQMYIFLCMYQTVGTYFEVVNAMVKAVLGSHCSSSAVQAQHLTKIGCCLQSV